MSVDRPILFSTPMVRALLQGRKTQTRRLAWRDPFAGGVGAGLEQHPSLWRRVQPGDRLWVRETWACHWCTDDQKPAAIDPDRWSVRYLADGFIRPAAKDGSVALSEQCRKTRVAIHMPRWASRLTLTVTDVRVQPLQDITDADAQAEGMTFPEGMKWGNDPRDAFHNLWTQLHGPGAWEANPAVVALTFTVAHRNIDG